MTNHNELEFIEKRHQQEIAHIYDLLRDICTFKKVRFGVNSAWVQTPDGMFKLEVPCKDYVALAAFEDIPAGKDQRKNCILSASSEKAIVTSTNPFDGYIVVADVMLDNDINVVQNKNLVVDSELNKFSYNPVTNKAIANKLEDIEAKLSLIQKGNCDCEHDKVYSWAKQPKKPCYSWDEICSKPNIVTSAVYGEYEFCGCNGTIDLSPLACLMNIPTRLSQLICDLGISDLIDDIGLEDQLEKIGDAIEALQESDKELDEAFDELKDKHDKDIDALQEQIDENKDEIAKLKKKHNSDVDVLKSLIKTNREECAEECGEKLTALEKLVKELQKESRENDEEIRSHVSHIASKQRIMDENFRAAIEEITKEITKLKMNNSDTAIELLRGQVTQNQTDITNLKDKVDKISIEHTRVEKSEKNGFVKVDDKNILVYDDEKIVEGMSDMDKAIKDAQKAAEDAQKTADEANEAIENLADSDTVKEIENRIVEIVKTINDKVATGVEVEESGKNGYVTVKVPKVDEEGNIVKDEDGNVQYDAKDIKVYEFELTDEVDERLVTEKELSDALSIIKEYGKAYANISFSEQESGDQIVSINDSKGLVWINGKNITVNMDEIKEIISEQNTIIEKAVGDIAELQEKLDAEIALNNTQADAIVALTAEINKLKDAQADIDLSEILRRLSALETNLQNWTGDDNGILEAEKGEVSLSKLTREMRTFVDEDGEMTEGEKPLWDKLNTEDTLSEDDIVEAFKNS